MFGYVLLNPVGASDEDKKNYKLHYCGLCKALERGHGRKATRALSYDMTFLHLLLDDLYNCPLSLQKEHCQIHPVSKQEFVTSSISAYVADMQLLLSYYSALDHVVDDDSQKAVSKAKALEDDIQVTSEAHPRQAQAILDSLAGIARCEEEGCKDPLVPAGLFGELMGAVFTPYDDIWAPVLTHLGQGLGRFVYILDAWDDLEKDKKKGAYNPFIDRQKDDVLRSEVKDLLTDAASDAAEALEKLPLDDNLSVLRNVIYSGIWARFEEKGKK